MPRPIEASIGQISKQGSALLRWVLGQAATPRGSRRCRSPASLPDDHAPAGTPEGESRPRAPVAVRLYIMLRAQIDYEEFYRRGRAARVRKDRVPSPA